MKEPNRFIFNLPEQQQSISNFAIMCGLSFKFLMQERFSFFWCSSFQPVIFIHGKKKISFLSQQLDI